MVENASVYSERNLPTSCPLIRIFCSRISLRNNIPIEKTCHYGNGAISLDFWYGECQKWIQICIWAPGPIFIPDFCTVPRHRFEWNSNCNLSALSVKCFWTLSVVVDPPKGTCYALQTNVHFLETSSYALSITVSQGTCKCGKVDFDRTGDASQGEKEMGQGVWGLWPVRVQWLHDMVVTTRIITSLVELASWAWGIDPKVTRLLNSLEKNGPAQNIWILLKNRSFWAKSLLKFSCKALGIPKEKKALIVRWSRQKWAFSKIMGNERF